MRFGKEQAAVIYEKNIPSVQYPLKASVMKGNLPFMNHCHQEMEVIRLRRGTLEVISDGEQMHLSAGDILIVPPFCSHAIGLGSADCERLVLMFDMSVMGSRMKDGGEEQWLLETLQTLELCSIRWKPEVRGRAAELVEELYAEYRDRRPAWQLAVKTLVNGLALTAVRGFPRRGNGAKRKEYSRMESILGFIALHYCEPVTLHDCAGAAGFNATYFSRYFSRNMGVTFQQYLRSLRLEKAKWLLMTEALPITEVCFRSGFQDVKSFNKQFKRECGVPPTKFRKSYSAQCASRQEA